MRRICLTAAAVFLIVPFFHAADNILFRSLQDEMNRSLEKLQIKGMPRPFFIEYNIMEVESLDIKATFGALLHSERDHYRYLKTDLRIGDYQLDSSEFIGKDMMFTGFGSKPIPLALENDYEVVRRTVWLATDNLYKNALQYMAQKQAYINSQNKTSAIPDFSREQPHRSFERKAQLTLDQKQWETILKEVTAVFKRYPFIIHSSAQLGERVIHNYFVNSEGSSIRRSTKIIAVIIQAVTQTDDGMRLKHFIPFYASHHNQLPTTKTLVSASHRLASQLSQLAQAPSSDEDYTGPVLFQKQAAAELILQVMAPHFSGQRPPLSSFAQISQMVFSSRLTRRLNRRVLPKSISVVDDPSRFTFQGQSLLGHYKYDEQGIPAQTVQLVSRGFLRRQLMSRRPSLAFSQSTGHCRSNTFGRRAVVISNLFVTSDNGLNETALKSELLRICREEEIPYGLMVKAVDIPNVSGISYNDDSYYHSVKISDGGILGKPLFLYRVYVKDGREELVRGLTFDEFSVRYMKDIIALGKKYHLHHRLIHPGNGMMDNPGYGISSQRSASSGIKCTIIVPDLLVREMDLKKLEESSKKPFYLKHPNFVKEDQGRLK
jgi:hypothetical protein